VLVSQFTRFERFLARYGTVGSWAAFRRFSKAVEKEVHWDRSWMKATYSVGGQAQRRYNMIRAKIQGADFQHHPFRDGRAQVLAASWPTLQRCGGSGGGPAKEN
jgi:hypothetical protein